MLIFIIFFLSSSTCSYALATSTLPSNESLSSRRLFLSPRDLQGVYSRFLEISENSTLCPNTIAHETSGTLYPTGNIHLPLNDISHDGKPCLGGGELVIRFRRTMQSNEIQNEFNITSHATGIDKMVRDILLALDGFYFGRQSTERKCHSSVFPSEMAFFFTSEARPFAANVGVPFRRSPKILFVVGNTRVCAFSSSFTGSKTNGMIKNPAQTTQPDTFNTPPVLNESVLPSPSPSAVPRQPREEPLESEESNLEHLEQTYGNISSKSTPVASESPVISASPSDERKMTPYKKKMQKQNKVTVTPSTTPSLIPKLQSISNTAVSSPAQMKEKSKGKKQNEDRNGTFPSSTQFHSTNTPQDLTVAKNPENEKEERQLPAVKPPKPPMPSSSMKPLISITPPFPDETGNEAVILSVSPHRRPDATGNAAQLHANGGTFNTDYIVPSSAPVLVSLENSNMSNSQSDVDLYSSTPVANSTETPTEVESDVILGDSTSTCFPSFATVTLSSGGIKRMDELSVGEFVYVGRGTSSRIIDFSHYDHTALAVFLRFSTESGRKLTVTPSHFVHTDKKLIPATNVVVGDYLLESDGRSSRVLKISTVQARGLFNPQTLHGDVVVDGFIVSTYTLAAVPSVAHSLLVPIRFLHQLGFRFALLLKMTEYKTMLDAFIWALSGTTHYIRASL